MVNDNNSRGSRVEQLIEELKQELDNITIGDLKKRDIVSSLTGLQQYLLDFIRIINSNYFKKAESVTDEVSEVNEVSKKTEKALGVASRTSRCINCGVARVHAKGLCNKCYHKAIYSQQTKKYPPAALNPNSIYYRGKQK